jgi:hypothetical protein
MAKARALKGSRRDLALVFGDGWKTAHEAATAMGRPTGSIFGVLRRMHAEGLLVADTDPDPATRGTQYRLSDAAAGLLMDALADESGVGRVAPGQRLLTVDRHGARIDAAKVLTEGASAGIIAWAAELPAGWLLVVDAEVDPFRVQALCAAFEHAGCRCEQAPVDDVVAGPLLRERAATLLAR